MKEMEDTNKEKMEEMFYNDFKRQQAESLQKLARKKSKHDSVNCVEKNRKRQQAEKISRPKPWYWRRFCINYRAGAKLPRVKLPVAVIKRRQPISSWEEQAAD